MLLSEIVGSIKLKVFLSGMPELRLGLNDRVLFELTGRKTWGPPVPQVRGPGPSQPVLSVSAPSAGDARDCSCRFTWQSVSGFAV